MPKGERRRVISCTRSDGRAYSTAEVNAKLIDKGEKDHRYTEPLKPDDKQYIQWLIKCSDMLVNEFDDISKTKDRYILDAFPAGYQLRAKTYESSSRHHFYLFGHPSGVNQVFRSPNEFVHHLIWLVSENEDAKDCFCRICSAQGQHMTTSRDIDENEPNLMNTTQLDADAAAAATTAAHNKPTRARGPTTATATTTNMTTAGTTTPGIYLPATSLCQNPVQSLMEAQPKAQVQTPPPIEPKPEFRAQKSTSRGHASAVAASAPALWCLYRVGEVIWFKNNNTWRLGLIKRVAVINQPTPNGQGRNEPNYTIQPIAHSRTLLAETTKFEMDTRPFLTFSVPEVQYPGLRDKAFSEIDWQSYVSREAGDDAQRQQLIGLEASKMAAVQIDHSFSLFNCLPHQSNPTKLFYGGIFLGPECIIVGEPVRVRIKQTSGAWTDSSQLIVLVTKHLFTSHLSKSFVVVGDLYHLKPSEAAMTPEQLAPLPSTMKNDILFRNRVASKSNTPPSFWCYRLLKQSFPAQEDNIMGRFYECHRILRIVDPASFQKAMTSVPLEEPMAQVETQRFLNARGDTTGPEGMNMNIGRVPSRFAAVSGAIPPGAEFPLGGDMVEDILVG